MDYAAVIRGTGLPKSRLAAGFNELVKTLSAYLPLSEIPGIVDAYVYSAEFHSEQDRRSGEAYINHPVAVAQILADLHLDAATIEAALLHDVVEDTASTLDEIRSRFGEDVALLVDGVSKLDKMEFGSAVEAQAESFRKMMLAMAQDLRVILVKLADRTHNMRTIRALPVAKQRNIARETLEIYAPIANRLGIYNLKLELEDLGFQTSYPIRYRTLSHELRKLTGRQRSSFKRIETTLRRALRQHQIDATVVSREKNLYSIYQKMKRKRAHLSEIVDLYGIRVIVADVDQCYRVLGLVHQLYKPMPGRFKDYIAIPRMNGYQSLHTTLFGIKGMPLEVQIRTEEMNKVAERGIAANWQYKAVEKKTNVPEERARRWLAGLVEMHDSADWEEFLETVKADLFPDNVYVFTPKGDIMRLPRGATTIDFAYAVHTDVGNRCVAAKVNLRDVPLRTQLQNGETVEIMTARGARPNPAWISYVVTAKARNAIRAALKELKKEDARRLGQRLLGQALQPYSISLRSLRKPKIAGVLEELEIDTVGTLYEQLGLGKQLAPVVARQIAQLGSGTSADRASQLQPLDVAGAEGMVVDFARCCYPIPGDDIVGFVSAGRGIVIHRDRCRNLSEFRNHPSKWVPVDWKSKRKSEFLTQIRVRTLDRVGLLAEIAGRISSLQSNIDFVRVDTESDGAVQDFRLKVRDRRHLAQVMRGLRTIPGVQRVARMS